MFAGPTPGGKKNIKVGQRVDSLSEPKGFYQVARCRSDTEIQRPLVIGGLHHFQPKEASGGFHVTPTRMSDQVDTYVWRFASKR